MLIHPTSSPKTRVKWALVRCRDRGRSRAAAGSGLWQGTIHTKITLGSPVTFLSLFLVLLLLAAGERKGPQCAELYVFRLLPERCVFGPSCSSWIVGATCLLPKQLSSWRLPWTPLFLLWCSWGQWCLTLSLPPGSGKVELPIVTKTAQQGADGRGQSCHKAVMRG